MRRFLLVACLVGCASHAASGPAWPKPHASDDDGGESIAPHVSRSDSAAAIETADDDAKPVVAAPVAPTAAAPASEPAAAPAAAPPAQPSEDTIIIDDVVIQIDD
ncbi:MAG TPA: hypothetical protein VMJ10_08980 [Kofleriaceae bacterium]|nr:hypothetical protein [Kofleriaceae bacterium]